MKTMLMAVLLCAAPVFAAPAEDSCGDVPEKKAGTVLPDGTVAGEKETLDYLKSHEPELHARVVKLDRAELRKRFARQLMWFQRVGDCRKRQKARSIRQLKSELQSESLSGEYKGTSDAVRRAELERELRVQLAEYFDSEMAGLEQEAENLEAVVKEFAREAAAIREKIVARKRSREAIIDKRLKELVGG